MPLMVLNGSDPAEQQEEVRQDLADLADLGLRSVIMHSGRDFWGIEQAVAFYRGIRPIEESAGISVAHETHRGRTFGTPWATAKVLDEIPELSLCCDFSHWVLVCERVPVELEDWFERAADRCVHLHARLGSPQAPQVSVPGDPRHDEYRSAFERWWRLIWDRQRGRGLEIASATPEYGPPPYQPLPATDSDPDRELRQACDWQAQRLRELFANDSSG